MSFGITSWDPLRSITDRIALFCISKRVIILLAVADSMKSDVRPLVVRISMRHADVN